MIGEMLHFYHSHLGVIDKIFFSRIRRPFFDEGEVGKVHAQIRNAGRVATVNRLAHIFEPSLGRGHVLELLNDLTSLCWRRRRMEE